MKKPVHMLQASRRFSTSLPAGMLALFMAIILAGCGGNTRPKSPTSQLADALSQGDKATIQRHLSAPALSPVAKKLAQMRLFQIEQRPVPTAALAQELAPQYRQMPPAQAAILKHMTLWANIQPIYRREIGHKVRILQREKLYLAPSHIDPNACQQPAPGCANTLRAHLRTFVNTDTINTMLMDMAKRDPCINLSKQLQSDEKAHRCLRKQMGELDVELLPPAIIPAAQWEAALKQ